MKKVVKFLALPLFASMILAACGGNEGDNGDSSSAAPTNSSVETPVSSSEAPKVSSSQEAPVVSSSTAPVASSTNQNPPASSSSQQEQHEHAYGDWTVVSEPTETEDGVEKRTCACGEIETRAIPRKQIKVNYGFVTEGSYTMSETTRGLSFKVSGGDAYGGMYKTTPACSQEPSAIPLMPANTPSPLEILLPTPRSARLRMATSR